MCKSGLVGRCPRFWLGRGLRGPPPRRPAQSGDPRPALRPPPASFWSGAPTPLQKGAGPCLIGRAAALIGPWESGRARGVGLLPAAPSPFRGPWPQSAARPRGRRFFLRLARSSVSPRPDAPDWVVDMWLILVLGPALSEPSIRAAAGPLRAIAPAEAMRPVSSRPSVGPSFLAIGNPAPSSGASLSFVRSERGV